jgi:mannose-6-phosphate isomerase
MASSDNVLRGGLTVKHVDQRELLRVARFIVDDKSRLRGDDTAFAPWRVYDTPAREVRLLIADIDGELTSTVTTPCIALALDGAFSLRDDGESASPISLSKGQSAFVCAGAPILVSGRGRLAFATVRLDGA